MATKRTKSAGVDSKRARNPILDLAPGVSDVVRRATAVLERELAVGLETARAAQTRFRETGKVDAADFENALSRLRENGHAVVDLVRDLATEAQSNPNGDLAGRLVADAHQALDLAMSLVEMTPKLIDQLVRSEGASRTKSKPRQNRPKPTKTTPPPVAKRSKPARSAQ